MQRKIGFTLAEVLITLVIIGVVAALTVPTLYAKYQKTETLSKFKKVYSVLNNALQLSIAENGSPSGWAGVNGNPLPNGESNYSKVFASYFEPYIKFSIKCENKHKDCWAEKLYSRQKSVVSFCDNSYIGWNYIADDGMSWRFYSDNGTNRAYPVIIVDLNGKKAPNTVGLDIFVFGLNFYTDSDSYNRLEGFNYQRITNRHGLLYQTNDACRGTGSFSGLMCSALIITDGFQIEDDYGW